MICVLNTVGVNGINIVNIYKPTTKCPGNVIRAGGTLPIIYNGDFQSPQPVGNENNAENEGKPLESAEDNNLDLS